VSVDKRDHQFNDKNCIFLPNVEYFLPEILSTSSSSKRCMFGDDYVHYWPAGVSRRWMWHNIYLGRSEAGPHAISIILFSTQLPNTKLRRRGKQFIKIPKGSNTSIQRTANMAILRNRSSTAFIVMLLRISFSEASETSLIVSNSESKKRRRNALSQRISPMKTSEFPQKRRERRSRRLSKLVSQSTSGSYTMDSASRRSNGISYESVNTNGPGYIWSNGDVISVRNGKSSSSGGTDVGVLSSRYRNGFGELTERIHIDDCS
jgi:hypothetical protein